MQLQHFSEVEAGQICEPADFAQIVIGDRDKSLCQGFDMSECDIENLQTKNSLCNSFRKTPSGKAADWSGMKGELLRAAPEVLSE
eukprot:12426655-Karenia_brevis.AAC.1